MILIVSDHTAHCFRMMQATGVSLQCRLERGTHSLVVWNFHLKLVKSPEGDWSMEFAHEAKLRDDVTRQLRHKGFSPRQVVVADMLIHHWLRTSARGDSA